MSRDEPRIPAELVRRYATAAPRYTSYPTAVDWTNTLELGNYDQRLARAGREDGPLSVYVHVPFCAELCLFCGCNVHITRSAEKGAAYLDTLLEEIRRVRATGIGARPLEQLHVGGGTPTFLSEAELDRLAAALMEAFRPAPGAEIGIEVDPRVTRRTQLEVLARHGFNRLSLGVQDFDPLVQEAVRRVQSVAQTRAVVDAARELGFGSLNIDLIYGLPHQTLEGFSATLDAITAIRPERIALFHYAHVPWMKKHQGAMAFEAAPSPEEKLAIFEHAMSRLLGAGYEFLGLDHFALPEDELARALKDGTLKRNFMGYGTRAGADLVGLGVSAIGEVDGAYWQNDPDLDRYHERIRQGGFAVFRGHDLDHDDEVRRDLIMGIMCQGRIAWQPAEARLGRRKEESFAPELAALDALARDGLVLSDDDGVAVTALGRRFLRNVAVVFDRYYRERVQRAGVPQSTFSRTL